MNTKIGNQVDDSNELLFGRAKSYFVKNDEIQDSIRYADLIQRSLFPDINSLESKFKDSYIIYKPKDVIGGDFYWMDKLNSLQIIICADCTGHGVPGAMLSMIGYQSLNTIIKENRIFDPGQMLTNLHRVIKSMFRENSSFVSHGIDMSVCTFNVYDNTLQYASAKRPIFIERNKVLEEVKGDLVSVGDETAKDFYFTTHTIKIDSPASLFQFSDGFHDQFGGSNDRKFGRLKLRELLQSTMHLPLAEQKQIVADSLEQWQGTRQQTDDISLIGIKLGA
ncbi:SpoIIE family protein phosphatase [Crocinitomix catalasitica]|nr:SpoIIE family protein phosphatase [Crocinitomix catalasitica]